MVYYVMNDVLLRNYSLTQLLYVSPAHFLELLHVRVVPGNKLLEIFMAVFASLALNSHQPLDKPPNLIQIHL